MTTDGPPVACSLSREDFQTRLAWIGELTRDALQDHERDDLSLHLRFTPSAVNRVREMIRQEEACCAFLAFDIREYPDAVVLTITAPESAREVAGALFDQFVAPDPHTR
jgi:hypothetical protein